jgi:hypothetical protein
MAFITTTQSTLFSLLTASTTDAAKRVTDLDLRTAPANYKAQLGSYLKALATVVTSLDAANSGVVSGITTIAINTDNKTVTVDAALNGKPVVATVRALTGGTGQFHATVPVVLKASIASGTLTISAINAITGAAVTLASNVVVSYTIDGR